MSHGKASHDPRQQDERAKLFPVLFMFLSLGNMIICLGLISFVQHTYAYALCALLYALLIATELRYRIKSPVSQSMLALYIGLTILDYATEDYRGYSGIIVFSWLTALTGMLLIIGKPFSSFYSSGRGMKQLHYTVSSLWTLVYFTSLLASIFLMPDVSYLVIPYFLCVFCGLFTIYLNLVWFGEGNKFREHFVIGEFTFRRLLPIESGFNAFCLFYARQIYRPGDDGNKKTVTEIAETVSTTEKSLGSDSYVFVAEYEGRIVGCIRCVLDRKGRPFPLEKETTLSFDPLRKIGKVLYVGRLAIDLQYRERPDVLNGLFKCFIDLALNKDVSFVVAEGFSHRLPTYLKLGFEILFERSDQRHAIKMLHGYTCHPVFLNFSKLIFNRSDASQQKYHFSDFINRYLVERWYKRTALRYIFQSPQLWPWRFSLGQVRAIL